MPLDEGNRSSHGTLDEAVSGALKASEVLARAADLIARPGGWMQGRFGRPKAEAAKLAGFRPVSDYECLCLFGAVRVCADRDDEVSEGAMAFARRTTGGSPIGFNDTRGRTQAEVVAALRKASDLAKAEGQ